MAIIAPVTRGVSDALRACLGREGLEGAHPGLVLDKFARSWDDEGRAVSFSEDVQKPTVEQVVRLSASPPPGLPFTELVERWEALTAGALAFTATTAGPLTLHLARASALENAGICLHPLYGFTYLPGSGLKGLARAFATEVWAPAQENLEQAQAAIRRVFGFAEAAASAAGAVVFHDAWPRAWPALTTDILNSHHAKYYGEGEPPGDWEDPVPVYFLSVPAGVPFRFALAKRRDDVPQPDLELAAEWLAGGLTALGCGAKTATGYGHFKIDPPPPGASPQNVTRGWGDVLEKTGRKSFTATLELVTPAFLAGANQQSHAECDLRPATLRGLLRWWWRTMHAGFVDVPTLRRLEAAIWGDTKSGGAVRVVVHPEDNPPAQEYARTEIISLNKLPRTPDNKTTQGLTYHSYGMDERKGGVQVRRFYRAPGAKWRVMLAPRGGRLPPASGSGTPTALSAGAVLEQARSALALLCHFGGVGAKGRKGFGSFADLPGFDLQGIKAGAANFRAHCGLGGAFQPHAAESPALEQMLGPVEVGTGGKNYWLALDQLAAAAQRFAKQYKHRAEKKALGLPRLPGPPVSGVFRPGRHVKNRHASPVLYHFDRVNGELVARVIAFPACELPSLGDSRKLLQELLDQLRTGLGPLFDADVRGKPEAVGTRQVPAAVTSPGAPPLAQNTRVKAKVTADAKGKGRPFAELQGRVGIIEAVPAGLVLTAGEEVELIIKSLGADGKQITFKWPG